MSAERLLENTWLALLTDSDAITAITTEAGIRREYDGSQIVIYPCVLVRVEPSADIEGLETFTEYKEARVQIICETNKDEDKSGSIVDGLYDAVLAVIDASSILADLNTASTGLLNFYESKIMPNEGIFEDSEEVRQRILIIRNKVKIITA